MFVETASPLNVERLRTTPHPLIHFFHVLWFLPSNVAQQTRQINLCLKQCTLFDKPLECQKEKYMETWYYFLSSEMPNPPNTKKSAYTSQYDNCSTSCNVVLDLLWFPLNKTIYITSFTQYQPIFCYHSNLTLLSPLQFSKSFHLLFIIHTALLQHKNHKKGSLN